MSAQVLLTRGDGLGKTGAGGDKDGGLRVQHGLLSDVGDAKSLLELQGTVVGFFQTGQNFEERGLAGTVAPDQSDALRGFQREIGVIEQSDVPVGELRLQ